jgi:GNAT superfamily N-acetyltransferase
MEDAESLVDLYLAVAEEGRYLALEPPIDRHERLLRFQQRVGSPWTLDLAAVADGDVVGHVVAVGSERAPAEVAMAVAKQWRGRGIGSMLIRAVIEWAREHGVHKLALEVFTHNLAAIALYEKAGFQREGLLPRHYRRRNGDLWDVLVMGLALPAETSLSGEAVSIRHAKASELDRLREIAVEGKSYWGYEPDLVQQWVALGDFSPEMFAAKQVYVAVVGSEVVGWSSLIHKGAMCWLDDMWVAPAWIRRGIGARIFRHAVTVALAFGAQRPIY